MDEIQVIKRDGSVEDFEIDKIIRVIKAAGLTDHDAEELGAHIEKWTKEQKKEELTSLEIRDKVVELMHDYDDMAADMFVWYQKTKDGDSNIDPTISED